MDVSARRSLKDVRVGFVLSHPFHYLIYRPLIRALPKSLAIIETRTKTPFDFSRDFLKNLECPYVILDEKKINLADQQVDVIFVMTPKHLDARFARAKTVLMQYGMAKEYYNYGLWRCQADLNMMYGPYSQKMIEGYAVSRAVGNTRLDGYVPPKVGGGGILYLPTYGALSTLPKFAELLPRLNPDAIIKVKLHHASEFEDKKIIDVLRKAPGIQLLDGYHDAFDDIAEADLVISDYSGAIFDALFLKRPVAMFQPGFVQTVKRTDVGSIEIARAREFGRVVEDEDAFVALVDDLCAGKPMTPPSAKLEEFLSHPGESVAVALGLLEQLINDEIPRSLVQESIRTSYTRLKYRKAPSKAGVPQAVGARISRLLFGK